MTDVFLPSATVEILRQRANILARIRQFFEKRQIIEVETPVLSHATVTDPYIISIKANFREIGSANEQILYLQTSPEYAMKRLLCAGMGSIYQLTKSFRQGEVGRLHNPEFTMLEWYRIGFDHHVLMDEMNDFFQEVLNIPKTERLTVANVFNEHLQIDPHRASISELIHCAKKFNIDVNVSEENTSLNFWLDLLFSHLIEPKLGREFPVFIYDFPVSQAALAKIRQENPKVASRFEVYFKGTELANGFHELQDAKEQRERFQNDLTIRSKNQIETVPIDERFLSALQKGLPECAGVALGIDRLIMLALGCAKISDVVSFSFERA